MGRKHPSEYQTMHPFETRQVESAKIRAKFADRVPVIVERTSTCQSIALIDKRKFIVPIDLTIAQFTHVIRKRLHMLSSTAIFIMCVDTLPPASSTIGELFASHSDADGFLYVTYSGENAFG